MYVSQICSIHRSLWTNSAATDIGYARFADELVLYTGEEITVFVLSCKQSYYPPFSRNPVLFQEDLWRAQGVKLQRDDFCKLAWDLLGFILQPFEHTTAAACVF
jgi:hypothetical protein